MEETMYFGPTNPDDETMRKHHDAARQFFNPSYVDQFIRQAIQFCWEIIPAEKRTPDELEAQIRRIVDRAIKDFREDSQAFFGLST